MSGISQPIGYCTSRSATTSQCSTFAVVPYWVRSVMISLKRQQLASRLEQGISYSISRAVSARRSRSGSWKCSKYYARAMCAFCDRALSRADQDAHRKHDDAAEHDLEHRLQEWRVHVARSDEGDRPQFEEHDDARDRGRDPERIRP